MYRKSITIQAAEGLHARPAGAFAKKAAEYRETKILVRKGDAAANAKSIMAVLGLGAGAGTAVVVEAEGPDEVNAVEALCAILTQ